MATLRFNGNIINPNEIIDSENAEVYDIDFNTPLPLSDFYARFALNIRELNLNLLNSFRVGFRVANNQVRLTRFIQYDNIRNVPYNIEQLTELTAQAMETLELNIEKTPGSEQILQDIMGNAFLNRPVIQFLAVTGNNPTYLEAGCYKGKNPDKLVNINGYSCENVVSRYNNCMLSCLEKIAGIKFNFTKAKQLIGKKKEDLITPIDFFQICHNNIFNTSGISIYNIENEYVYKDNESLKKDEFEELPTIIIKNNHAYLVKEFIGYEVKCPSCKNKYLSSKKHICLKRYETEIKKKDVTNKNYYQKLCQLNQRQITDIFYDIETYSDKDRPRVSGGNSFYRQVPVCLSIYYKAISTIGKERNLMMVEKNQDYLKDVNIPLKEKEQWYLGSVKENNQSYVKNFTKTFEGTECVTQFMDFLLDLTNKGIKSNVYAHNGSRFDHYIFLEYMVKEYEGYLPLDLQLSGSKIIFFSFANHIFRCTSLIFPGKSLDALGKDFRVKTPKLKEIKYNDKTISNVELMHLGYENNKPQITPIEYIELLKKENLWRQMVEYCETDCIALFQVVEKYKEIMLKMLQDTNIMKKSESYSIIERAFTASSLSKKIYDKYFMKSGLYDKIYDEKNKDYWNENKQTITGGISHNQKQGKFDNVTSVDVISLYPSVMEKEIFPLNDVSDLDEYKIEDSDSGPVLSHPSKRFDIYDSSNKIVGQTNKIFGMFTVEIKSANDNNLIKPVPHREHDMRLDWNKNFEGVKKLNSEDINRCLRYGYKIKIHSGYYYNNLGIGIYDQFFEHFKKMKKDQDILKENDDENYNNALRELCKLIMNGAYGKTVENTNRSKLVPSDETTDIKVNDIYYKKVWSNNFSSPNHIGSFILAYSKTKMFEYYDAIGHENVIQTETDSVYFETKHLPKLDKFIGNDFGFLKVEHKDKVGYFVSKKIYKIGDKMIFKGIPNKLLKQEHYTDLLDKKKVEFSMCMFSKSLQLGVEICNDYTRTVDPNKKTIRI